MRSDLLRLSVLLASAVGLAAVVAADPPRTDRVTAQGLLATFEQTVARLSCVHLEATQTAVMTQSAGQGADRARRDTGSQTVDVTLYRDRFRWRLSYRNRSVYEVDLKKRELSLGIDFLLGEG